MCSTQGSCLQPKLSRYANCSQLHTSYQVTVLPTLQLLCTVWTDLKSYTWSRLEAVITWIGNLEKKHIWKMSGVSIHRAEPGEFGKFPDVVMRISHAHRRPRTYRSQLQRSQNFTPTTSHRSGSRTNKTGWKVEQKLKLSRNMRADFIIQPETCLIK